MPALEPEGLDPDRDSRRRIPVFHAAQSGADGQLGQSCAHGAVDHSVMLLPGLPDRACPCLCSTVVLGQVANIDEVNDGELARAVISSE